MSAEVREPAGIGAMTDIGKLRSHNEDAFLIRRDLGLYLVADGMGGHQAGDVASALVTLSMSNFFEATRTEETRFDDLREPEDETLPPSAVRLLAAIRKANRDVYTISNSHQSHRGMGSTVVAAHAPNGDGLLHVGHVGDSRCYRLRRGRLEQVTRDHSLINEARALDPTLTDEELARVPSNIITRALGMEPSVEVDLRTLEIEKGDVYLLCSDGLSGMVTDFEIRQALELAGDPRDSSDLLVELANEAGGFDNITAVVLRF